MSMEITIELGHKAWKNIKLTKEGYTHDWIVFVQGVNGSEIKHIVDRVIFYLPDTYQDSKRIKEKPPFILSDSSSENISVRIDVCLCTEAKLDKVNYIYNVNISDEDVNSSLIRKLTFPNPSNEFKEKLLLAGGEFNHQKTLPALNDELLKCKIEPSDKIEVQNNLDNQKTLPVLNEGLLKCKVEPDNEITIQDDTIVSTTKNAAVENLDRLKEIMKENENLKRANVEIKERMGLQEKLMACYEDNLSYYEKKILNTNVGIDQLKRKIEDDEREISSLKLQLLLLQNALLQFKNSPSENFEEKTKETMKKNEEGINLSVPVEKENVTLPTEFLLPPTRDSLKPLGIAQLHNNTFVSTKNQNVDQTEQLNSITSVALNASQSKTPVVLSDLCNTSSKNFFSPSINETRSLNSNHPQNFSVNQNLETMDCHENASNVTLSLNSTNICDVQKPIENKSLDINVFPNEFDIRNNVVKSVDKSLIESNSSLNTPKRIIADVEKSAKRNSVKANHSLNKSDKIIIDGKKSPKRSITSTNDSLNASELMIIDSEKSAKTNYSLNISEIITVDGEKSSKRSSSRTDDSPEIIIEAEKSTKRAANANDSNVLEIITIDEKKSVKKNHNKKLPKNKKLNQGQSIKGGNFLQAATSVSIERETNKTQEQFESPIQKHNVSVIKRKDIKTSKSNFKQNNLKQLFNGAMPLTSNRNRRRRKKQKKLRKQFEQHQSESSHMNSPPKFVAFLNEHCQKLAKELDRIKHSEFRKYKRSANPLFSKLTNIDTNSITDEDCKQFLQSLIDYFSNSRTSDMATLIYMIVDYFCHDRIPHENLPTCIQNESIIVFLTPSENCIISALFEVDNKSLPHLIGLVTNTLNIIHQVIIAKKNLAVSSLASLCRVFMEICRRIIDRWKPLYLCCELLRVENPLAPYLIMSLASVWRDPFKMYDRFSVEENMVLGAIMYGIEEKPLLMDNHLWRVTCQLRTTYFPVPFKIDHYQAIQFLTNKIVSTCMEGLLENLWMLALPLIIFVANESLEWKKQFKNEYILPNLWHFLRSLNEMGFGLFCNMFVDIFKFSLEEVYESMMQFFSNPSYHHGIVFVYDCAALALLKCTFFTDQPISHKLKAWFLKNQNHKLCHIMDLYCRKVMECHDSVVLWEDIIIV